MRLESFEAPTLQQAIKQVRETFGGNALIVATDKADKGRSVRITAARGKTNGTGIPALDLDDLNGAPTNKPVPILRAALADNGVREELANRLLEAASRVQKPVEPALALAAALITLFEFQPLGKLGGRVATASGLTRATLLVGPPGSGKTVTAAKMAARASRANSGVQLVSIDTVKTGGAAHLRALADALGVDMRIAGDPRELSSMVASALGDVVIVDSKGINPFDPVDADNLARFVGKSAAEPILVLPAGLDRVDASETARAFARMGCKRMIVTRIDMSRRLGSVIEAAHDSGIAFSDVSVSPEISAKADGGLSALNPVALGRLMLPMELLLESAERPDAKAITL